MVGDRITGTRTVTLTPEAIDDLESAPPEARSAVIEALNDLAAGHGAPNAERLKPPSEWPRRCT